MTPTLTPVPYEQFLADVRALALAIRDGGWRPDYIVGIGRGGLVPAAYLSHALDLPLLSVDFSAGVPCFGQDLLVRIAERSRGGEKLLIVDDINDSGRTLAALRAAVDAAGGDPANLRTAVTITNIRSTQQVDYAARQIDRDLVKDWFVFPWEAMKDDAALIADANAVPERIA